MENIIRDLLLSFLSENMTGNLIVPISIIVIALLAYIAYLFCHIVVAAIVNAITRSTETEWDDDLFNERFLKAFSQLAPALLVAYLLPGAFRNEETTYVWLTKLTEFYILWAFVNLANKFLQNLYDAFDKRQKYKIHTLKGVFQIMKLFFIALGVIAGISILFDKSPFAILTAVGASAAVLMLVFKDTILGLVAGVQLTANDMLKKGDWIVVPKSGANGVVSDVSLTTVKVTNWDNSITIIPPYTLVSESFQNFRPMQQSGGRRVMRSIYIDINTVSFCSQDRLDHLVESGYIKPDSILEDSRRVNLELFRIYLERYLSSRNFVRNDMLLMIRQLQPTPNGLPLELYFFVNDTGWKQYEHLQSEVFNHVYATIHEFGLAIYQAPAGDDLRSMIHVNH